MNAQPFRMLAVLGLVVLLWGTMLGQANAISGADRARLGSTIVPNGSVMPEYSSGSVTFVEGNGNVTRIGHNWDAQPSRVTRLSENYRAGVGGNQLDIVRRTHVPAGAIAKASAAALKGLPVIGTGIALWEIWDAIRVGPDGAGGLVHDEGVSPSSSTCTRYMAQLGGVQAYGNCSPSAAASALLSALQPGSVIYSGPQGTVTQQFQSCTATSSTAGTCQRVDFCSGACWGEPGASNLQNIAFSIYEAGTVSQPGECPASIDAFNPAYSLPAGLPVGPDGKCRQARGYWQPITPEAAAGELEANAPPEPAQLIDMAEDALTRGQAIPEATAQPLSGPTSVTGTPTTTTTTKPDGTTVTKTSTPTTHYTYNNQTINYTTTITTVTNDNGQVTTTTEGKPPEETDTCKQAPDSLGCAKLGTPGTDAPGWQVRDVVFAPEDLGFAGACPSSESWEVFGITLAWGYEPVCDVAPVIRLCLLVFAGIGAIAVVIRETSS